MSKPPTDAAPEVAESAQPTSPSSSPLLSRMGRALLAIPAAIWLFIEEWLWDAMLACTSALAKLPPIRWAESQIAKLPPYAALVAFLIPVAVLLPFKLVAFWLIAHGKSVLGTIVFIVAKIIGTAFLARIFALTKPALMTIGWFARAYTAIHAWKQRLYVYVSALPLYQAMRSQMHALKVRARGRIGQLKRWWQRPKRQ